MSKMQATTLAFVLILANIRESHNQNETEDNILMIVPYFLNGSEAPSNIYEIDEPGTIEVVMLSEDDIVLNLELTRNKIFKKKGYKEYIFDGTVAREARPKINNNCRFYGTERSHSSSEVLISFCNGVSGHIYTPFAQYKLWPIGDSVLEARVETTPLDTRSRMEREKREGRYAFDRVINILEMYIVNDVSQFHYFRGVVDDVFNWAIEVTAMAAKVLQRYDFHIALVGIELWDDDFYKFNISEPKPLDSWLSLKNKKILARLPKHDTVFFFVDSKGANISKRHLSRMYSMCDIMDSGAIILASHNVEDSAYQMLHHIGRLLGLKRETEYTTKCSCPARDCIMHGIESSFKALTFSDCSTRDLTNALDKRRFLCLITPVVLDNDPVCGNGFLERNEECDCGTLTKMMCNPRCCHPEKCLLLSHAKCASGKCCHVASCSIKRPTKCRPSRGSCDIAELCDGVQPMCPDDLFVGDGERCEEDNYCFSGRCGGHRLACKSLWGRRAREGGPECYVNNLSNAFYGHCYSDYSRENPYKSCTDMNMMCGILMCQTSDIDITNISVRPSAIHATKKGEMTCRALEYKLWKNDYNPGFVPDGAVCAFERFCLNRKCIDANLFPFLYRQNLVMDLEGRGVRMESTWLSIALPLTVSRVLPRHTTSIH